MRQRARRMPYRALRKQIRKTRPRSRRVLRPSIHTARHHDLRCELPFAPSVPSTVRFFPFFEQGEEGEGEPVGTDGVYVNGVGEGVFGDGGVVGLDEVGGGGGGGFLERACEDAFGVREG